METRQLQSGAILEISEIASWEDHEEVLEKIFRFRSLFGRDPELTPKGHWIGANKTDFGLRVSSFGYFAQDTDDPEGIRPTSGSRILMS